MSVPLAAHAATLDPKYPQTQSNLFFNASGPSFGFASAIDPQTLQLWVAGSGFDASAGNQTGAVLAVDNKGNIKNSFGLRLGQFGSPCSVGGFNYCQAGSSSVVRGLALDATNRVLWAAGTQFAAGGGNPVMFVAAIDLNSLSVTSFLTETSTGTEARGAAVSADGSVWVAGLDNGSATLWNADPALGMQVLAVFAGAGEADATVEAPNATVWVTGQSGDTGEMALWNYDPVTGTFAEYLWSNTLGGTGSFGLAAVLAPSGKVLIAGRASVGTHPAALLWSFSGGVFTASASTGTFADRAFGLALDDAGNAWLTGTTVVDSAGDTKLALWDQLANQSSVNLAASYNDPTFTQTPYINAGRGIVYSQGGVFVAGIQDDNRLSVWRYTLDMGNLSGTLRYSGGFTGHNLAFALSQTPSFNQQPFISTMSAPSDNSTAFAYTLVGLAAPATYYLAAVYDLTDSLIGQNNKGVPPGDPLGVFQDDLNGMVVQITPIFVPAGSSATNVNFTLSLDTQAPSVGILAPVAGSTITANLFALSGTAVDDTSVSNVFLAVQDLTANRWWDGFSSFISTTTAPLYSMQAQQSGPINMVSWSLNSGSLSPLAAALQAGRSYEAFVNAQDLVGKTNTTIANVVIVSSVPPQSQSGGQALARSPDGHFWVVANDFSFNDAVNFRLERYDSAGVFLSSVALPGANQNGNFGIAFDPSGNAWVAGGATSGSAKALGVWESDPAGAVLVGSTAYVSTLGGQMFTGRLAVDASGNAWVPAAEQTTSGFTFQHDLFKFTAGAVLAAGFPATYQRGGGLDGGFGTAVDSSGNIWSAGVSSNPATGKIDLALWKNDSSGNLLAGFPVFWPDAFKSVDMIDVALTISMIQGKVWIATEKDFSACASPEFALLRFDSTGVLVSSSLWHNSSDTGAKGRNLALDGSGNVWAVGQSSSASALWKYDSMGNLSSGYPKGFNGNSNSVALDAANQPWVLSGNIPTFFTPGAALPGSAGPALCALTGTGQVSGIITSATGFASSGTATVAASTSVFLNENNPLFFMFVTSSGTTLAYDIPLQAPATYSIAAVGASVNGELTPGTPIGSYNDFAPVAVAAGATVPNISFSIAPDNTPPTSLVTSIVNGSTLTAISAIAGTAADNVGAGKINLAVHDLTFDLWWAPFNFQQQWISTTTTPLFQNAQPRFSGKPNNSSWIQDIRPSASTSNFNISGNFGGLGGFLSKGHRYQVFSQAQDFVRNIETNPAAVAFLWNGPSSGALPPAPPRNVQGFVQGISSISWTWDPPSNGASSYNVYSGTAVFLSSTTQTSFTGTGLSTNTAYQLCVSGLNQFGEGAKACAQTRFTFATAPGRPVFTTVSSMTVAVTWDPQGDPAGTAYQVYFSSTNFAVNIFVQNTTQAAASFSTNFQSLTPVQVEVRAFNGDGFATDFSPTASTTTPLIPPSPPQNVAGTALGISSISWTWTATAFTDGYKVYSGTGAFIAAVATNTFAEVGLSTASQNFVCVSAFNAAGESGADCGPSVYTLAAVPGRPVLTQATSSTLQITWDSEGNQNTIYQVTLSTDGFITNVSTPISFASSQTFNSVVLGFLAANTTYFFRVQAENGAGQLTDFSPVGSGRTLLSPPQAPVNLTAITDQPDKLISLAWQASSTGTPAVSFRLWRGASTDTASFFQLASTTGLLFTDRPSPSGTYYYQVSGVNADGIESVRSTTASAAIDLFPPQTISDLRVSAIRLGQGQADLAWTAPTDDFSGVARYFLLTSTVNSFGIGTSSVAIAAQAPGSTVTFTVSVTANRALFFEVDSQDYAGNISPLSNTAIFDAIPPVINSIDLADGATLSRPRVVTAQVSDNVAVGSVLFEIDSVTVSTATTFPYSFLWVTPNFADGLHGLTVVARDTSGNVVQSSITVLLNYAPPAPPTITFPANGFATHFSSIAVSGTAESGTNVEVFVNQNSAGSIFVSNGLFTIPSVQFPGEGSISLTAITSDARGSSPESTAATGTFTTGPPNAPQFPTAQSLSGGQVQITWSAPIGPDPAAFYRLYRSSSETALVQGSSPTAAFLVADDIGLTVFTDSPAVDGLYFYAVTSMDAALNESVLSDTVPAVSDRLLPTASIVIPDANPVLGLGMHLVRLNVSKVLAMPPILTITPQQQSPISIDLTPTTPILWQGTVTVTANMNPGPAAFHFQGTDFIGNVGSSITAGGSVYLRTQGPVGSVTLSKASPLSVGPLGLTLTLDEAAVSTPTLTVISHSGTQLPVTLVSSGALDGTAWSGGVIISSSTGDGPATLTYSATDQLGNLGTVLLGGTTSFIIDTTPPGPPQVVRANPGAGGIVTVSWSAPLGERPSFYYVYRDGVRLSTQVTPATDGSGIFVDNPPAGQHRHQVSAVDFAGNEGPLADPFSVSVSSPPPPPVNLTVSTNSFGQIELNWQAGSTTTASYRLYRTTYSVASVSGLPFRPAAPPFVETPAVDGNFHYVVTGLDSVGNESSPSNEAVFLWDQGAPSIAVFGVANGGYYNTNVSPVFAVTDVALDTTSIRAFLDSVPFVSGSTVSAEGVHTLVVSAANTVGHVAASTTVFTLDKTPPAISFSVPNGASITSTSAISVQIQITDLNPAATSFVLINQTLGTFAAYNSGDAIGRNGQYILSGTATDKAGNVSTGTISFHLEVAPLPPATLSVVISNTAQLSWVQPEPDVVAYRVFRDGVRISASLYNDTFFQDTGYTPGAHVYQVSAVDAAGVEGPRAQATVPPVALSLQPVTLTRGFIDAIQPVVQNNSSSAFVAGPAVIQVLLDGTINGSAVAPATVIPAGQSAVLEGDIATSTALPAAVVVKVAVTLPTDPGARVTLAGSFTVPVIDPPQPIVELYPAPLVHGAIVPVQMRFNNRGSAAMLVKTAVVSGASPSPSDQAFVSLATPQGTMLSEAGINQTSGGTVTTQVINGFVTFFASVSGGSSFLFNPISLSVPAAASGNLIVSGTVNEFTASQPEPVVSSAAYIATVASDKPVYDQGSQVILSGQALNSTNNALVPGATVQIGIASNGFTRTLTVVTGSTGSYTTIFNPSPTEAGIYALSASNPQAVSNAAQSSFTIVGFGFSASTLTATMSQSSSLDVSLSLINTGQTALAGLISALFGPPSQSGVSAQVHGFPASLAAGAQANLTVSLTAGPSAATGPTSLILLATDSHGFIRQAAINVQVSQAQPIGQVTPSSFQLGIVAGSTATQTITLQNLGFLPWQGVTVSAPTLPWATLQAPPNIGDIPPGGSASFNVVFAPPANLPNQQYQQNPLFQVQSANAASIPVNAGIVVTSNQQGTLSFNLINGDLPRNNQGQGVGLAGVLMTLTSISVPGLTFTASSDANGFAVFNNIPSGNYLWVAKLSGFRQASGTVVVQPGLTMPLEVLMFTSMVTYDWNVTPTTIKDVYNITLDLTFKTNVSAPIVVVDPMFVNLNLQPGQSILTQYTMTNRGVVSAFNVQMHQGNGNPALKIEQPFTFIPELKPGQSVVVPVKVTFVVDPPVACIDSGGDFTDSYVCAAGGDGSGGGPLPTYSNSSAAPSTNSSGCADTPGTSGTSDNGGGGGGAGTKSSSCGCQFTLTSDPDPAVTQVNGKNVSFTVTPDPSGSDDCKNPANFVWTTSPDLSLSSNKDLGTFNPSGLTAKFTPGTMVGTVKVSVVNKTAGSPQSISVVVQCSNNPTVNFVAMTPSDGVPYGGIGTLLFKADPSCVVLDFQSANTSALAVVVYGKDPADPSFWDVVVKSVAGSGSNCVTDDAVDVTALFKGVPKATQSVPIIHPQTEEVLTVGARTNDCSVIGRSKGKYDLLDPYTIQILPPIDFTGLSWVEHLQSESDGCQIAASFQDNTGTPINGSTWTDELGYCSNTPRSNPGPWPNSCTTTLLADIFIGGCLIDEAQITIHFDKDQNMTTDRISPAP